MSWEQFAIAVGGFSPLITVGAVIATQELFKGSSSGEAVLTRIPKPIIATHTTTNEEAVAILQTQRILPGVEGVCMSMNQHAWGEPPENSIFVFDLRALMLEVDLIPSFYLLPELHTAEFSPSRKFKINAWTMITWAEISTFQEVSLKNLRYVVSYSAEVSEVAIAKGIQIRREIESTSFTETFRYWEKVVWSCVQKAEVARARAMVMYPKVPLPALIPCNEVRGFLFSYNRMVADMFNVNLTEVEDFARDYCIRYELPVWWSSL